MSTTCQRIFRKPLSLNLRSSTAMLSISSAKVGFSWEEMRVFPKDTETYTKPTYQIYMGGIAAADTFLINTKTGRTWVLVKASDDSTYWEEFY